MNDITRSFQIKHEKLVNEENELKEELNNKVTEVKKHLEKYLSQTNNEIKKNERINRGINIFKNEYK